MQGVAGDDERRMTIVQHLEELRRVLIWVMAAWIVGTDRRLRLQRFLHRVLLHPLQTVLKNAHSLPNGEAIFTSPRRGSRFR